MTEDEALLRWCPHSRVADREHDPISPTYNRLRMGESDTAIDITYDDAVRCVGERCMAWRWMSEHQVHGYCGLAGAPQ